MGILTKSEIIHKIKNEKLIIDAHFENGEPVVEPASYDLRAGIIIWKESGNNKEIKRKDYNPAVSLDKQEMVTIQPGQVMFVITREMVNLPLDMCGTVYAKNEFSRAGILLFTTGHVDPGIQCPIVIRLVNLRATPYALTLGHPIYTIVFHMLQAYTGGTPARHENISMLQTIDRTKHSAEQALDNALYDLSLLSSFIKKDEFEKIASQYNYIKENEWGKAAWKWIRGNSLKAFGWLVAILVFLATIIGAIPAAIETWNNWRDPKRDSINPKPPIGNVVTHPSTSPLLTFPDTGKTNKP